MFREIENCLSRFSIRFLPLSKEIVYRILHHDVSLTFYFLHIFIKPVEIIHHKRVYLCLFYVHVSKNDYWYNIDVTFLSFKNWRPRKQRYKPAEIQNRCRAQGQQAYELLKRERHWKWSFKRTVSKVKSFFYEWLKLIVLIIYNINYFFIFSTVSIFC